MRSQCKAEAEKHVSVSAPAPNVQVRVGLARPTEHVLRRYAVRRTSSRAARFSS
jgi:hypothetical protein